MAHLTELDKQLQLDIYTCAPHFFRTGRRVAATQTVNGTPFCEACFSDGKPVKPVRVRKVRTVFSPGPPRKVTDEQVAEIRRRRASGERGIALATEYGVSPQLVSALHRNQRRRGM